MIVRALIEKCVPRVPSVFNPVEYVPGTDLADCPRCGSLQPFDVLPGSHAHRLPDLAVCMGCFSVVFDVFPDQEEEWT